MNHTKGEGKSTHQKWLELAWAVCRAYVLTKSAPEVTAIRYDPMLPESTRLTANGIHFCADVESSIDAVLKNHPDERESLLGAWRALLRTAMRGDERLATITAADARLGSLLGPIFRARGMAPRAYFAPNRHPQPKNQRGRARLGLVTRESMGVKMREAA